MKRQRTCRVCQRVMRWLLRFAPASFREWGNAMIAEAEVMDRPLESLRWSLGCVGILLRQALWNICFGACCATWIWITDKEEDMSVRKARVIAVSALLVVLGFFFAPSFRQAMSVAADTLDGAPWARQGSGESALAQALITAERQHDAMMLAYVAVHEEQIEPAQEAADQAVAIDPKWTWVYYVLARHNMRWDRPQTPQSAVWIEKLRQWDPQNAEIYFLEADRLAYAERLSRRQMPENQEWVQLMAHGFDSEKYDSYFAQGFDLDRDMVRRHGSSNPLRFTVAVIAHPVPNLIAIRDYEKLVMNRAQSLADVVQQAKRVALFGERMTASDTEFEEITGQELALDGYQKLQPLASQQDQAWIAARIALLSRTRLRPPHLLDGNIDALIANAVIVQVCFVLIIMAAAAMAVSAGFSLFRRVKRSGKINLVFFTAAGAMLMACLVAFIAYLPYSHLVMQAMAPQTSVREALPLLLNFLKFATAPRQLFRLSAGFNVWPYFWMVVLVALSLLALWLIVRQFRKTNPALS